MVPILYLVVMITTRGWNNYPRVGTNCERWISPRYILTTTSGSWSNIKRLASRIYTTMSHWLHGVGIETPNNQIQCYHIGCKSRYEPSITTQTQSTTLITSAMLDIEGVDKKHRIEQNYVDLDSKYHCGQLSGNDAHHCAEEYSCSLHMSCVPQYHLDEAWSCNKCVNAIIVVFG